MLGMKTYPQDYIDACRARVDAQLAAYRAAVVKDSAVEAVFFNNMVIVLDSYFTHRLRGVEGKDGNPLNEVRVLASSMMQGGEKLVKDTQIKLDPETSVLGLEVGATIALTEADFVALSKAFFAELETKFAE